MDKAEIKELMFEWVEYSDYEDFRHIGIGKLVGYDEGAEYPFFFTSKIGFRHIRKIQPKVKRLMTVEELWGKTLVHASGETFIFAHINANGEVHWDNYGNIYKLQCLSDHGWKVNDKPSMDGATSLEVEK